MVFTIMKRIKNITFICILAGMIAGCTGNFDSMNKNPLAATEVTPSLLLTKMEEYGFNCRSWEYQVGNNLYTNDYAQYVSNTATYFATANYEWKDNWANDGFWKSYYTYLAKPLNPDYAIGTFWFRFMGKSHSPMNHFRRFLVSAIFSLSVSPVLSKYAPIAKVL